MWNLKKIREIVETPTAPAVPITFSGQTERIPDGYEQATLTHVLLSFLQHSTFRKDLNDTGDVQVKQRHIHGVGYYQILPEGKIKPVLEETFYSMNPNQRAFLKGGSGRGTYVGVDGNYEDFKGSIGLIIYNSPFSPYDVRMALVKKTDAEAARRHAHNSEQSRIKRLLTAAFRTY